VKDIDIELFGDAPRTAGVRHLINENGEPFEDQELHARAIARHAAVEMLIVAGPGTGKSTLFKERILFWLEQDSSAGILALSFVRKLVADLDADIANDAGLTDAQKKQIDVCTLHKYARRVVEQNHGTKGLEICSALSNYWPRLEICRLGRRVTDKRTRGSREIFLEAFRETSA
jgi:superfamily I DNA/RNA helicase